MWIETVQVTDAQQFVVFHSRLSNRSLFQTCCKYYSLHGNTIAVCFLLVPKQWLSILYNAMIIRKESLVKANLLQFWSFCVYFKCCQRLFHNIYFTMFVSQCLFHNVRFAMFVSQSLFHNVWGKCCTVYQKVGQSDRIITHLLNDVLNWCLHNNKA